MGYCLTRPTLYFNPVSANYSHGARTASVAPPEGMMDAKYANARAIGGTTTDQCHAKADTPWLAHRLHQCGSVRAPRVHSIWMQGHWGNFVRLRHVRGTGWTPGEERYLV